MGDRVRDISSPFQSGVGVKVGGSIPVGKATTIGGTVGYNTLTGGTLSSSDGYSMQGNGESVDPQTGARTTQVSFGPIYGTSSTSPDGIKTYGLGVRISLPNKSKDKDAVPVSLKAGVEISSNQKDVLSPTHTGTTQIAPGLHTNINPLGTVDEFGSPQVRVTTYAELPNGKTLHVRTDVVSRPPAPDKMLRGDIDRRGPGYVSSQDAVAAIKSRKTGYSRRY